MFLYLKSKDELAWPCQINMQQHTPNSNTISLPLFFPQILPTFTTGYGSVNQKKEKGLLLYCCHLCALLSGLSSSRFWSTSILWKHSKAKATGSGSDSQMHFRQYRAHLGQVPPSWSPPSCYMEQKIPHHPFSLSCLCKDLSQIIPSKNWTGIFAIKTVEQLWSAQPFLKSHRGRGASSLSTDDNHYHKQKKKASALLTAAKCSTGLGFAVINVTFTMGFATWKSIICFPGTCAWLSGESEASTEG